jgi:hypothetical protein
VHQVSYVFCLLALPAAEFMTAKCTGVFTLLVRLETVDLNLCRGDVSANKIHKISNKIFVNWAYSKFRCFNFTCFGKGLFGVFQLTSVQLPVGRILCSELLCINLLKTKRNVLYIRNQFVPRSKHFPPRL